MKIYLAGPMTGYPDFNYPAFHDAATHLRAQGHAVINPAENHGGKQDLKRIDYLRADLPQVLEVEAVVVLPGWEQSFGAKHEVLTAQIAEIPIWTYNLALPGMIRPADSRMRVLMGVWNVTAAS